MSSRRIFLRALAAAAATGAWTPGCASVASARVQPVDGRIRLDPGAYPGLDGPSGFLRVQPEGASVPIYLFPVAGGYAALSPVCTHLGCTVEVRGERLECPCHGSTYDRSGRVLRGPAERPLRAFPVRVLPDGTLVIELTEEGRA